VTALCPVVDLQPTIEQLFSNDAVEARLTANSLWPTLKSAEPDITDSQLYFPSKEPTRQEFPGVIGNAMYQWDLNWRNKFDWSNTPFSDVKISSVSDAWNLGRFQDYVEKLKVPTLYLAANDDQLVSPDLNTKMLIKKWGSPQHGQNIALIDNVG